jgi:hypothetical protein
MIVAIGVDEFRKDVVLAVLGWPRELIDDEGSGNYTKANKEAFL